MNSLVRDVMTSGVVAVERATPFKEDVARPAQHRIKGEWGRDANRRMLGSSPRPPAAQAGAPQPQGGRRADWDQGLPPEREKAAAVADKVMTRHCGHHGAHRGGR